MEYEAKHYLTVRFISFAMVRFASAINWLKTSIKIHHKKYVYSNGIHLSTLVWFTNWIFLEPYNNAFDDMYQLDATIVIYYRKYLYMFRASICPSSGVQVVCYCIWCSALGVVVVVLWSRCVVLCTVCKLVSETNLHTVHKTMHTVKRPGSTRV
jgi:hypothetical protein